LEERLRHGRDLGNVLEIEHDERGAPAVMRTEIGGLGLELLHRALQQLAHSSVTNARVRDLGRHVSDEHHAHGSPFSY